MTMGKSYQRSGNPAATTLMWNQENTEKTVILYKKNIARQTSDVDSNIVQMLFNLQ